MASQRWSRRQLLKVAAGSVVGAGGLSVLNAFTEPHRLELVHQTVGIKDLPESFEGYQIAVVSDLHFPRNMSLERVRHALSLGMSTEPDLLVIPGDLTDKKGGGSVPTFQGMFDGFQPPDGLVAVLGNHDHWWDAEQVRANLAKNTPVELIEQRHRILERRGQALAIGGVGDLWSDTVDPVATFKDVPPEVPRILISHNPDVAEDEVWDTRIDLQISGHTHGGEICTWPGHAPFVPSKYKGKFRRGLAEGRSHRVYVSRGITSPRKVRFLCRPEVTCLTLTRQV